MTTTIETKKPLRLAGKLSLKWGDVAKAKRQMPYKERITRILEKINGIENDGLKLRYKASVLTTALTTDAKLSLEARIVSCYVLSVSVPREYECELGFIIGCAVFDSAHASKRLGFTVDKALRELVAVGILRRAPNKHGGEQIRFTNEYVVTELRKDHEYRASKSVPQRFM